MHPPASSNARTAARSIAAGSWAGTFDYAVKLRWVPFMLAAVVSIAMSFDAPVGRKPFGVDWDVGISSLAFSLFKESHIGASALIGMLAVTALQRRRWFVALLLAVAVGAGWEVGQTTVIGHSARLADLLPDALGAAMGVAWGASMLWLAARIGRD